MKGLTKISIALAMTVGMTTAAVAGDAKAPPPTAGKKEEPKKMEMPKPGPEMAEMSKAMLGTWKCTGKMLMDPTKPTEWSDVKMTMKFSADKKLAGWWITGDLDAPMFKGTMWVTYDPTSKKFYQMAIDSMGGSQTGWSTGIKDGKMVWEGDGRSPMPGMSGKYRESHDMSDAKVGDKMVGEMSMDAGKTWMKGWEATCKK